MNKDTVYWIWIQRALGYGSAKTEVISSVFSFAEDFYRLPYTEKLEMGCFTAAEAKRLKNLSTIEAENIVRICMDKNIDIVSLGDENYPSLLRRIPGPPAVLYTRGCIEAADDHFCISMVGTRRATAAGKNYARQIAYDLAKENICVVSGGAKGIDHYSHLGALDAGGITICVLGCGHEAGYLREFDPVKQEIIDKGGAVISEYAPYDPPSKISFPIRNRIISGLSKGVVVVEAGHRSGSSITAGTALEQGRDVFALADEVSDKSSEGTRALIFDGAIPVVGALDVMVEYLGAFPEYRDRVLLQSGANGSNYNSIMQRLGSFVNDLEDDEVKSIVNAVLNEKNDRGYIVGSDEFNDENVLPIQRPDFLAHFDELFLSFNDTIQNEAAAPQEEPPQKRPKSEAAPPKKKTAKSSAGKRGKRQGESPKSRSGAADYADPVYDPPVSRGTPKEQDISPLPELSPGAEELLKLLREGPQHIDKIAEKTGLSIPAIHAVIMELELNDLIEMTQGRVYQIKS